jgi:hypothetical protein
MFITEARDKHRRYCKANEEGHRKVWDFVWAGEVVFVYPVIQTLWARVISLPMDGILVLTEVVWTALIIIRIDGYPAALVILLLTIECRKQKQVNDLVLHVTSHVYSEDDTQVRKELELPEATLLIHHKFQHLFFELLSFWLGILILCIEAMTAHFTVALPGFDGTFTAIALWDGVDLHI